MIMYVENSRPHIISYLLVIVTFLFFLMKIMQSNMEQQRTFKHGNVFLRVVYKVV